MFIQTEDTPNPATIKFRPGIQVLPMGTADYPSREAASNSPLAQRLFDVEGVKAVFLGYDFISVTKVDEEEWFTLKPAVLGAIMEHFTAGQPVIRDPQELTEEPEDDRDWGEDQEIVDTIKELLDARVRPAVAQDGGDIVFHGFDKGVVYLHMRGACAGCPSATATLKSGIENLLRHFVPEVSRVEAVNL